MPDDPRDSESLDEAFLESEFFSSDSITSDPSSRSTLAEPAGLDTRLTPPKPATGSPHRTATELAPEEQPIVTGTLFLMIVFLMMVAGFWGIMYYMLLHR